jgi:1,4-dihydroxy-2-naphthoyl-CoA hydrolase
MKHTYSRRIRFADTDAAGVVYFANYLSICHEAYEDSLEARGIELRRLFSAEDVIIPISNARADYYRPMQCGDKVEVEVTAQQVKEDAFFIDYQIFLTTPERKLAGKAKTAHVCLDAETRARTPLPTRLVEWIQSTAPDTESEAGS